MRSPLLFAVAAIMAVLALATQADRSRAAEPSPEGCAPSTATSPTFCSESERKPTMQKPLSRLPIPA